MSIIKISRWIYFGGCLLLAVAGFGKPAPRSATSGPKIGHAIPEDTPNAAPGKAKILALFIDHTGKLVAGPPKEDLLVKLDGKAAEVEDLQSLRNQPLIFSLVVDESGSTHESADKQTNVAVGLFRALSTGSNRGFLVEFDEHIYASDQFVDTSTVENQLRRSPRRGPTKLFDALIAAATRQMQSSLVPPDSRRAILVISDGEDNSSLRSLPQTLKILQSAGTPVFSIKCVWDRAAKRFDRKGSETLIKISEDTGGQVILPNDEHGLIKQMPNILEGQYLITLNTVGLKPNKAYSLKIKVPGKDIQALAQSDYIAP